MDETEFCFGNVDGPVSKTLGAEELPFWGYALLFADLIEEEIAFRYASVRSGWQYLNAANIWSEHD